MQQFNNPKSSITGNEGRTAADPEIVKGGGVKVQ